MSAVHDADGVSDLVPLAPLAPAPVTADPGGLFSLAPWVKRAALSTARVVATTVVTVAVNVVALAIAIPLGIAADNLFWSIAFTELGLLVVSLIAAIVLAARARRGQGAGVLVGWAAAYLGLLGVVIAVIVGLMVLILVAYVLFWGFAIIWY